MSLRLYTISPSRGSIAHWMLEEVGQPYEVSRLDSKNGENRKPAYLAINPMGKVPALDHDGVIITEAAAICCYLADRFPQTRLSFEVTDPRRGPYLKWLFFGPSVVEPAIIERALKREPGPRGMVGWGEYDQVVEIVAGAVSKGTYLFGEHFTAADVVIGSGIRWGMHFGSLPKRDEFVSYVQRLEARPALQRVLQQEQQWMAG